MHLLRISRQARLGSIAINSLTLRALASSQTLRQGDSQQSTSQLGACTGIAQGSGEYKRTQRFLENGDGALAGLHVPLAGWGSTRDALRVERGA